MYNRIQKFAVAVELEQRKHRLKSFWTKDCLDSSNTHSLYFYQNTSDNQIFSYEKTHIFSY